MKKLFTVSFLLFFFNILLSQERNKKVIHWDQVNNVVSAEGDVITKYPNSEILESDIRVGEWIYRYNNYSNSIGMKGNFKNDLKEGEWKTYYPSGKLFLKGYYKIVKDKKQQDVSIPTGTWISYWEDGKMANIYTILENGEVDLNNIEFVNTKKVKNYQYSSGFYANGDMVLGLGFYNNSNEISLFKSVFNEKGKPKAGAFYRHGDWEEYYPTGELRGKGTFYWKSNYAIGPWKFYYKDGSLKSEVNYNKNRKKHGIITRYHPNGQLKSKENLVNDNLLGLKTIYDTEGNLIEVQNGDGKGSMQVTKYWQNGNKKYEGKLTWSELEKEYLWNDEVSFYFENGKLEKTSIYKDDNVIKYITAYDKSGKQIIKNGNGILTVNYSDGYKDKTNIFNGRKHGDSFRYFKDGNLKYHKVFSNGELKKTLVYYNKNRNKEIENGNGTKRINLDDGGIELQEYKNGIQTKSTTYYKNGQEDTVFLYKNGEVNKIWSQYSETGDPFVQSGNGVYTVFHENGKINIESEYKNGCRDGLTKWYYPNGMIRQVAKYKYHDTSHLGLRWKILSSRNKYGESRAHGTLADGEGWWYNYNSAGTFTKATYYSKGLEKKVVSADEYFKLVKKQP